MSDVLKNLFNSPFGKAMAAHAMHEMKRPMFFNFLTEDGVSKEYAKIRAEWEEENERLWQESERQRLLYQSGAQ